MPQKFHAKLGASSRDFRKTAIYVNSECSLVVTNTSITHHHHHNPCTIVDYRTDKPPKRPTFWKNDNCIPLLLPLLAAATTTSLVVVRLETLVFHASSSDAFVNQRFLDRSLFVRTRTSKLSSSMSFGVFKSSAVLCDFVFEQQQRQ